MMLSSTDFTLRLAIAAILRNEYPYVIEWIAHHRVLGVTEFFIADNVSDDGTSELLVALDALGYVTRIPFPTTPGEPPQLGAYAAILEAYGAQAEWIAFIDADEFMMPTDSERSVLPALVALAAHPEVGAVVLNWAVYGSSWHRNHAAGLICERFVGRARQEFGANYHYKTILRSVAFGGRFRNPHAPVVAEGWQTVHADGRPLVTHERHGLGLSAEVVWDVARVNHYLVKSREEFFHNKSPKASAAAIGRIKDETYFRRHDRNDQREEAPSWLIDATWKEVASIEEALAGAGGTVPVRSSAVACYDDAFVGIRGSLDFGELSASGLLLRGWALHGSGRVMDRIAVELGGCRHETERFMRKTRKDIQRLYPMCTGACGYEWRIPREELPSFESAQPEVYVQEGGGGWHGPLPCRRGVRVIDWSAAPPESPAPVPRLDRSAG